MTRSLDPRRRTSVAPYFAIALGGEPWWRALIPGIEATVEGVLHRGEEYPSLGHARIEQLRRNRDGKARAIVVSSGAPPDERYYVLEPVPAAAKEASP